MPRLEREQGERQHPGVLMVGDRTVDDLPRDEWDDDARADTEQRGCERASRSAVSYRAAYNRGAATTTRSARLPARLGQPAGRALQWGTYPHNDGGLKGIPATFAYRRHPGRSKNRGVRISTTSVQELAQGHGVVAVGPSGRTMARAHSPMTHRARPPPAVPRRSRARVRHNPTTQRPPHTGRAAHARFPGPGRPAAPTSA